MDHFLNHRRLTFRNANNVPIEIDLAASDEGVAFRYRFTQKSSKVRVVESELTGFTLPPNARGWLQPYHAAGPYTPAYEDFYFHVSPGDPPPDSRAKAVGWAFPALFQVPDAATWVLLTESGTDESYCACHLAPDSSGGLYRIAFPWRMKPRKVTRINSVPNRVSLCRGQCPGASLFWANPLATSPRQHSSLISRRRRALRTRRGSNRAALPGLGGRIPMGRPTANLFDEFTDFAAKMGWEYTLFDAGWWKPGLKPIASHAACQRRHAAGLAVCNRFL